MQNPLDHGVRFRGVTQLQRTNLPPRISAGGLLLAMILAVAGCAPSTATSSPATSSPAVPSIASAVVGLPVPKPQLILPRPPQPHKLVHAASVQGKKLDDDYFWMQKKDDPEVREYLEAENRYADAVLQHTEVLQKKLYGEFLARTKENDQTVPQRLGDYYYYTRWEKDRQYDIHCRRHGSMTAPEEVLLDENELAEKHDFFSVGAFEISPDQQWLVYGIDTTGSEQYTLQVKNLKTGKLLDESIANTGESVTWANDNRTIFYTTRDKANRPCKLMRHEVGAGSNKDVLVYEEKDGAFFLSIARTRSNRFLLLELASNTTSEIRYLDASNPSGEFKIVEPRKAGVEYDVRHQGDSFWIVTNDHARNFRLMKAPVATPDRAHWQEVLPNREDVKLETVDTFADYLVLTERSGGLPRLQVRDIKTGATHDIAFTEPDYSVSIDSNPEFQTEVVRFTYSSPRTPDSVFQYDMKTQERKLLKRDEVKGGYNPDDYETERIMATAADGTKVPISLVYKRGLKRDGRNPTLLYAYGAYGFSTDTSFDIARLSLLDRGFIYAVAHVRGGGELGRQWYDDGRLKNKQHTFTDFIACAEHLVREKYTSPQRLAITGASAGGLLIGAVVNMRPDLFQAVVADVPFVDTLHTMLDPKMPLTVTEYEEWGNPQVPEYFDLIRTYSPYDNVRSQAYPHMLVRGSFNDTRVSYWEPAKWVAKLRANKTNDNLVLLKVDLEAGHNGVSGRYDYLDSEATEYAFLLDCLGITE